MAKGIVHFYCINGDARVLLDKIETDQEGRAIFIIEENPKIVKDSIGSLTFEVEYKKSALYKGKTKDITIKQANLEMSFFQKDTVKYIDATVTEIGTDGQLIPIEGVDVVF